MVTCARSAVFSVGTSVKPFSSLLTSYPTLHQEIHFLLSGKSQLWGKPVHEFSALSGFYTRWSRLSICPIPEVGEGK